MDALPRIKCYRGEYVPLMAVKRRSKHALAAALHGRYPRAVRAGEAGLLDEFRGPSQRTHLIRLLRADPPQLQRDEMSWISETHIPAGYHAT